MHPPQFDYYRAGSVSEAVSLMQQHPGAKYLAGGHSLIPLMNLRLADPGVLIDIGRIDDLIGITATGNGGFRIGALTTHAMVASHSDLPAVLREAAGQIGDPQVRNRGTVGGNVAHADPASDLPTVFMALEAMFHLSGPNGNRMVAANEFFLDLFTTALEEGEILTAVEVPPQKAGAGSAYMKLANPASRYCMVGAAAVVHLEPDGRCHSASVAVGGLTAKATRAAAVEAALQGQMLNADTLASAAAAVQGDLGSQVLGDIHASAEYRRAVAPVFVRRALAKAVERAR
ncbi:MAG: xanthine dehydrogenase family protein subunit M [Chloroflexi bacterium]|nr:xanthine dehydrogenase family protein subunit M [Chloroflexota bacterium]MCI0575710.1 xanthine dehydrogenase family protein subunit M [Chloroflexota bacterium]MCI0648052.1 xanthine dehydrogenase family protein subunit M [Chloroflexota bacterium]MCI0725803.1 xanthine dehydrogenase family protein subunit M [Chloroflexota bacterium]